VPGLKTLASYSTWCGMVRGPLMWLGEADPVKSMDQVRDEDPTLGAIRELFESGLMRPGVSYKTKEIIKNGISMGDEILDLLWRVGGHNGAIDPAKLGIWLKSITGRVVNGKRLFRNESDKQRPKWVLAETPGPPRRSSSRVSDKSGSMS
jgi:putative DNA primase/helicase